MYSAINVMLPTMGRGVDKLPAFISSCLKMADNPRRLFFTVCVHECDDISVKYLKSAIAEDRLCIITENEQECNLSLFFNRMYEETTFKGGGILVSMFGDDMKVKTRGWDKIIIDKANDSCGLGIVYGDDDYTQHDRLCVYFAVSRRLVEMSGKPFMCPLFKKDWIDVVWYEVGKRLNLLEYIPTLHIEHQHYTAVGHDSTSVRMRKNMEEVNALSNKIPAIVDEIVENIRAELKKMAERKDIACVMTTYDRIYLLRKTVKSIEESVVRPVINVFDDGSTRLSQVKKAIPQEGFVFNEFPHAGCLINHKRAFDSVLRNKAVKWIAVVDSDSILYKFWWVKVCDMVDMMHKNNVQVGGLFNKGDRATGGAAPDGYVYVNGTGGIGMVLSKEATKYITDKDTEKTGWDNMVCRGVIKDGGRIICTEKSYVQHAGFIEGLHATDRFEEQVAKNFCGDIPEDVVESKIREGDTVLMACMARKVDCVYAAIIANSLAAGGAKVKWLTIPHNVMLVECLCTDVGMLVVEPYSGNPLDDWSEITSYRMRELYPGHTHYINTQMSSRENSGLYRNSELPKVEWLKKRMKMYTDITMNYGESLVKSAVERIAVENLFYGDGKRILVSLYAEDGIVDDVSLWDKYCNMENVSSILLSKNRIPEARNKRNHHVFGLNDRQIIEYILASDLVAGIDSWVTELARVIGKA